MNNQKQIFLHIKRWFYITFFTILFFNSTFAQETKNAKTIFDAFSISNRDLGFALAASWISTQMDDAPASLMNIKGGLNLKDKFTIGMFYQFSLNNIRPSSENIPTLYLDYKVFGGFFEFTLLPKEIIHFTFPISFGFGEIEMDSDFGNPMLGEKSIFQLEMAALTEINLHKNIRLNAGIGYRHMGKFTYRNLDQNDLSGWFYQFGIKLGIFR